MGRLSVSDQKLIQILSEVCYNLFQHEQTMPDLLDEIQSPCLNSTSSEISCTESHHSGDGIINKPYVNSFPVLELENGSNFTVRNESVAPTSTTTSFHHSSNMVETFVEVKSSAHVSFIVGKQGF